MASGSAAAAAHRARSSHDAQHPSAPSAWHLDLVLDRGAPGHGDARVLDLRLHFDPEGSVDILEVYENTPSLISRADSPELSPLGPQWETFDGRTTQRIWLCANCFTDPTNTLLRDTLELSTGRLVAVVDRTVWELYEDDIRGWCDREGVLLEPLVTPGNEDQKTMDNLLALLDELARVDPLRRSEPVLAIGGGVLTDMAGFACALWRRGIPWCRMPTTLLGMVDASVGVKVATNYHRKNGIGAFHSPLHTFIDPSFLHTVPIADIRSGVGEMMKAALIHDGTLFDLLEEEGERLIQERFTSAAKDAPAGGHLASDAAAEAIRRSVDAMLQCIGPDLWEESLVRPMDFGHSLSRTLEATEAFKLRHGEAVAIDCAFSTLVAAEKGLVTPEEAQRVLRCYAALGLPCSVRGVTADTYKRAVREITVHRDGLLRAPLPRGIGACAYADKITDEEVEAAFAKLEVFLAQEPHVLWDRKCSFNPETDIAS